MRPWPRLFVTVAGILALTACSILGRREDLTTYAPTLVHSAATISGPARAWHLSVAEPRAISPLNGTRIAVMPETGEIQTYKGARWRDSAPVMVQQLLLQAFQDSALLGGIGAPTSVLHADFALQSDLQDFQAEYRGEKVPTVIVRLDAQLVENFTRRAVAVRTFSIEQPCTGTRVPEVFAAFQAALNRLLPQVVEWTMQTGDANWSAGRLSGCASAGTPAVGVEESHAAAPQRCPPSPSSP